VKKPSGKKKATKKKSQPKPSEEQRRMEKYKALLHEMATNPKKKWEPKDEEWMVNTVTRLQDIMPQGTKIKISRSSTTKRITDKKTGKVKNDITEHKFDCDCTECSCSLESVAWKERQDSGDARYPPGTNKQTELLRSWRLDEMVAIRVDTKGKPVLDCDGYPLLASGGIRLVESQRQKRRNIWIGSEIKYIISYHEWLSAKCFGSKVEKFVAADFAKYVLLKMKLQSVLGRFVSGSGRSQNNAAIVYADLLNYVKTKLDDLKKMKKAQEKTALGRRTQDGTVFQLALRSVTDFIQSPEVTGLDVPASKEFTMLNERQGTWRTLLD